MKQLLNKTTIIVAIVCILVGRYVLTPKQETKIVTKIVEVEKKQVNTDKKTVIKETINPDGTVIKETVETDNSVEITDTETKVDSSTTTKKGSSITLGLLAIKQVNRLSEPFEYGATVSVPLIGNLNVTGLVTTDKRVGLGVSLGF